MRVDCNPDSACSISIAVGTGLTCSSETSVTPLNNEARICQGDILAQELGMCKHSALMSPIQIVFVEGQIQARAFRQKEPTFPNMAHSHDRGSLKNCVRRGPMAYEMVSRQGRTLKNSGMSPLH